MPRKTCKFRLSRNSTKFNVLARFRKTILMVKSVLSSEIQRINFGFLIEITILPFLRKIGFSRVLHIYCRLFLFYFYKFFSISFDLKKVEKVREVVEQFKEIGIVPIIIILEFVSLFELQIGLTSFVALLPNFIFFGIGIAFSFNFSDFLVFFSGASLSCLFSITLCICTLFFFF